MCVLSIDELNEADLRILADHIRPPAPAQPVRVLPCRVDAERPERRSELRTVPALCTLPALEVAS